MREKVSGILYKQESYEVLGACFEVYKRLGTGYLESVYQEALEVEFRLRNVPFVPQATLQIEYRGMPLRHTFVADFLCFNEIILEIKAMRSLADEHRAQVINYLKVTGKQLGLLINFGHYPRIEHERFINQRK